MLERYGCDLTEQDREAVRVQIKRGLSKFLRKTSNSRTVHEVMLHGKPVIVVWDRSRSSIVTVLPNGGNDVELCSVQE